MVSESLVEAYAAAEQRLRQLQCSPEAFDHPTGTVEWIETHISWLLLAGDFVYKFKKPLKLDFLDFSTPALRRTACEEELRINRRTAPALYLGLVALSGPAGCLQLLPADTAPAGAEPAVRMRRFAQEALLSHLLEQQHLLPSHIDALAQQVAQTGQQERGGEQGDAAGRSRWQMFHHEGRVQMLQMPATGEEGAFTISMQQADRHGGIAGAGLQFDADAGQLQQQPLGKVIVANGANQARAETEVAGGQGGVGCRATGAQFTARQQLFGADPGPMVQRAQDQVHADIANDAELGLILRHGATIGTPNRHCQ